MASTLATSTGATAVTVGHQCHHLRTRIALSIAEQARVQDYQPAKLRDDERLNRFDHHDLSGLTHIRIPDVTTAHHGVHCNDTAAGPDLSNAVTSDHSAVHAETRESTAAGLSRHPHPGEALDTTEGIAATLGRDPDMSLQAVTVPTLMAAAAGRHGKLRIRLVIRLLITSRSITRFITF